jgi:hypothetical protein
MIKQVPDSRAQQHRPDPDTAAQVQQAVASNLHTRFVERRVGSDHVGAEAEIPGRLWRRDCQRHRADVLRGVEDPGACEGVTLLGDEAAVLRVNHGELA